MQWISPENIFYLLTYLLSCAAVGRKYNIAKQTLSNWMRDKKVKFRRLLNQIIHRISERQRLRQSPYENVDKVCYTWLVNARHRNIPISATLVKDKKKSIVFCQGT